MRLKLILKDFIKYGKETISFKMKTETLYTL